MQSTCETETSIATAQIVDACMRLKLPYRIAPAGIKPIAAQATMVQGPATPVRHYGSVDIFFEALELSTSSGIFVIDNNGRTDEACIGDLAVLEVKAAGYKAIIVWGLHRDTADLLKIGFPVFSYGTCPAGPSKLDAREDGCMDSARFGDFLISKSDTVFADQDGVVVVETAHVNEILRVASAIKENERQQAELASNGTSMREQFQFKEYLQKRAIDSSFTFRKHLSSITKSIEE